MHIRAKIPNQFSDQMKKYQSYTILRGEGFQIKPKDTAKFNNSFLLGAFSHCEYLYKKNWVAFVFCKYVCSRVLLLSLLTGACGVGKVYFIDGNIAEVGQSSDGFEDKLKAEMANIIRRR